MNKRPLTLWLFFLRLFSGLTGGVVGSLVLMGAFLGVQAVLPVQAGGGGLPGLATVILAFVGTLVANTVVAAMTFSWEAERLPLRKKAVTQVLLFNLALNVLTVPLYLAGLSLGAEGLVAALHLLLSAFVSFLLMELLAGEDFALLSLYGGSLGFMLALGVLLLGAKEAWPASLLALMTLPMGWSFLEMASGLTEAVFDRLTLHS